MQALLSFYVNILGVLFSGLDWFGGIGECGMKRGGECFKNLCKVSLHKKNEFYGYFLDNIFDVWWFIYV